MSLKKTTPCDYDEFNCPYNAMSYGDCEYWCGAEEEEDNDYDDFDDDVDETGFNPYLGGYNYDC